MSEMRPSAAGTRTTGFWRQLPSSEVLGSVTSTLSWDQETMLPRGGTELRAEQMAMFSSMVHERTDPRVGEWLAEWRAIRAESADPPWPANLREIRRQYDRAVRSPPAGREMAQTTTLALQAWRDAREKSDFPPSRPGWRRSCASAAPRRSATAGRPRSLYDALMEGYEPGTRTSGHRSCSTTWGGSPR
jgi:carboxypeptidase Taq